MNEKQHKKEFIKFLLKDVLYNSLAQAIIKIILTPYLIIKVFLGISVLVSTILTSYLVIQSIMTYLSYGVITTSRTIYENPASFPEVTFCNVNWRTTQYAYEQKQLSKKFYTLASDEKKKFAHNLSDILIECWFNGNKCSVNDFVWTYDDKYKNCFTFNSGVDANRRKIISKKSNLAGFHFGLELKVYVNIYEKLLKFNDFELGALVRIGNGSYFTDNSNNNIFLSPGFNTYVSLEREFKFMLPKPYSNCEIDSDTPMFRHDSDLFNLIGHSNYDYSQQLCFMQCLQKKFIEKYNCTSYTLISLYNVSQCNSPVEDMIWSMDDSFDRNLINNICLPLCPLECNETLFKTSISFSQFTENYLISNITSNPNLAMDFMNRTVDAMTARESFVDVNIFYNSLSYVETSESPKMDMAALLASVGGNLGLFLGVSVFSLCELVEALLEIYFLLN